MTRRTEAIRDIWSRLPELECKGLCQESCGPIDGTAVERNLLKRRGVELVRPMTTVLSMLDGISDGTCPALADGRCSVYEDRPTICRLWGLVAEMPCEFGCVPVGGHLAAGQGFAVLARVAAIGGRSLIEEAS
ncbi:MAG: hypothetical protein JWO62_2683 [Acidimicrobiaceae bacterium]|nr:hypothetical protein [Acidimicrobiaceae bacterium]